MSCQQLERRFRYNHSPQLDYTVIFSDLPCFIGFSKWVFFDSTAFLPSGNVVRVMVSFSLREFISSCIALAHSSDFGELMASFSKAHHIWLYNNNQYWLVPGLISCSPMLVLGSHTSACVSCGIDFVISICGKWVLTLSLCKTYSLIDCSVQVWHSVTLFVKNFINFNFKNQTNNHQTNLFLTTFPESGSKTRYAGLFLSYLF